MVVVATIEVIDLYSIVSAGDSVTVRRNCCDEDWAFKVIGMTKNEIAFNLYGSIADFVRVLDAIQDRFKAACHGNLLALV